MSIVRLDSFDPLIDMELRNDVEKDEDVVPDISLLLQNDMDTEREKPVYRPDSSRGKLWKSAFMLTESEC